MEGRGCYTAASYICIHHAYEWMQWGDLIWDTNFLAVTSVMHSPLVVLSHSLRTIWSDICVSNRRELLIATMYSQINRGMHWTHWFVLVCANGGRCVQTRIRFQETITTELLGKIIPKSIVYRKLFCFDTEFFHFYLVMTR